MCMGKRGKSGAAYKVDARLGKNPAAVLPDASTGFATGSRLLQRKYQELVRKHLSHMLEKLFAEFTGLHFHIAWTVALPEGGDAMSLPTGCSVCCRLSGSPLLPECRICGPHHLAVTKKSSRGHGFTCRLGVRNYWLRITVRNEMLGIAYLQALEHAVVQLPTQEGSGYGPRPRPRPGAKILSRVQFTRAARLLRFVVQHLQTASLSDLRKADLSSAGRAVVALEREQARLHKTPHRHLPGTLQTVRQSGSESRPEQIVHRLLERIESDYAKPITLQTLANDLGRNGAYLSTLFSHAIGIPFKTYLTELRLQNAKELLGDSAKTASEVALAVGYSSEERFRSAFKKATGLSPKTWRETMQVTPLPRPS
jgi:AraC-like DNA-binding protein